MSARFDNRASVGTMAKVTSPPQDFSVASITEVDTSGTTRWNLARFCAVSSSRWANTQALAPSPIISPVTAESIMDLPAPVGATPSVLPREASAATLRSTKVFWRGRRRMSDPPLTAPSSAARAHRGWLLADWMKTFGRQHSAVG
ncbi:hypothetical protein ROA7023_04760 [Roseisalinus antarcticus]|uniref:Uncharacterized protein n=1 Tax=Roseisalinus antarcticus TaxID=254357 RepID=A0A1Y5U0T2_9RHOB|nr:hypothetical protein ROA7023_04760 [Roseisalinus antarcticus]